MCKTISKYKCGTCASCYASKRNSLAVRLLEQYRGIERNFARNHRAVLFGMHTYDDDNLPKSNLKNDVVTSWASAPQAMLKRLNKKYPFLRFEYYIAAEYAPTPNHRFHLHPLYFVTPKDTLPKMSNATKKRYDDFLRVLSDTKTYKIKVLKSRSKKRDEIVTYTAFEKYVREIIKQEWPCGLTELRPVISSKAVIYVTKYMTKSRSEFFRRRSWLAEDTKLKLKTFKYEKDSFKKYRQPLGKLYSLGHQPVTITFDRFRMRKRYYRDIYKSYLMSNGMGDYFYETPQWLTLFNNFALQLRTIRDKNLDILITPKLRYYNYEHTDKQNKGYSLPLKYRQHLYNLIAPKLKDDGTENEYRLLIASAGKNSLEIAYYMHLKTLFESNGIKYTELPSHSMCPLPELVCSNEDWKMLNRKQLYDYHNIKQIKEIIFNKNENHEVPR